MCVIQDCYNKHKKSGQYLKAIREAKRDANQLVVKWKRDQAPSDGDI